MHSYETYSYYFKDNILNFLIFIFLIINYLFQKSYILPELNNKN